MAYKIAALGTAMAAAIVLAACKPGSADQAVIRIGSAAPLTGEIAHLGKDNENGARLAVDDINAAGGVKLGDKTYRLELVGEDDKADPREGTLAAQKLVDEGVIAVVGHLNSGTSIPASRIYADANVVQISPSSTNPKYTLQGFRTTYRVLANDNQQGAVLADFAANEMKVKRVAIVDDRTQYGQGLADVFESVIKDKGVDIIDREFTTNKATDFNAILTKIRSMKPDLVMFGGMDSVAAPLAKQMKELGMKSQLLAGDGSCDPSFISIAGDASGVLTCTMAGRAIEKMPKGEDFATRYKAKFGTEVKLYSPYSYDAVYAIVDALKRAGRPDRLALVDAMPKTSFDGLTGHIEFDEHGDLKNGEISVYDIKGGKLNLLSSFH
ncbi:MAG TPA: branched-chain amino acid ABC transporter substrate-binding protein [Burkholderiaceae bacterium]